MQITTWNVNGIRAAVKKNFIEKVEESKADIYCVQETKAQDNQVNEALFGMSSYHLYSLSAIRKGYSGVAILTKEKPIAVNPNIGISEHDQEGRVLTLEYNDFFLTNVYVPNSGSGLKRLDYRKKWDEDFAAYLADLRQKKPIIVTGDFNVAHQAIDLARPKSNYNKTSGYTQTEIDGMTGILDTGLKDSFRELYPEKEQYTFWSMRMGARPKNIGWRIDYFLVDEQIFDKVEEVIIQDQIMGSDHCPVDLIIDL